MSNDGVVLQKDALAVYRDRKVVIRATLGLKTVLVEDLENHERREAEIRELGPVSVEAPENGRPDLSEITDEQSEYASFREEIVRPLMNDPERTREKVRARAKEFGFHPSALYEWMAKLEADDHQSSLLRKERADKGVKRLDPLVEDIIKAKIEEHYLTPQRKDVTEVHGLIKDACENAQLPVPHYNTVLDRTGSISQQVKVERRHSPRAAHVQFAPTLGHFPGADFPGAVVQIDHTRLDIIVVDKINRLPMRRPWLTVAFDGFSRMVQGFCLSLDPPGAMGTGLCLVHAILPKEQWLAERGSTCEWPIWGKPVAIHADNAKEFRGNMLRLACKEHGMQLIFRKLKTPEYGAYIERWLGTLAKAIHRLPGTTFSNTDERDTYDSEHESVFTLDELDEWLTERISLYHLETHSELGMPPIKRLEQGLLKGTAEHAATGLPMRMTNPDACQRLRLDLTPFEERTVQRYGVQIDKIFYYHDVLRRWIDAPDPEHPTLARQFKFRRYPRDISTIWFYDPDLKKYYPIPYRDTSFPPMSIWELNKVRDLLKQEGVKDSDVDEAKIKERLLRMRTIEQESASKTKAARTAAEQRSRWGSAPKPGPTLPESAETPIPEPQKPVKDFKKVRAFTDED